MSPSGAERARARRRALLERRLLLLARRTERTAGPQPQDQVGPGSPRSGRSGRGPDAAAAARKAWTD